MKIHKEGHKLLRNLLIIIVFIAFITYFLKFKLLNIVITLMILILFICLNFFRVPKRKFETKNNIVYAPCDGKIVVIEETLENEFFKDKRIQISIFMSPFNVHNNLYPISGKIIYTKYHPGKFLFAWNPKASKNNERNSIVISNSKISILCSQIAGALARRIISYAKKDTIVKATDEIGFIKFGSRVDVFLPLNTVIEAKIGDKTIGGKTILAKYK